MSQNTCWYKRKLLGVPCGWCLVAILGALAVLAVLGILFLRREAIEYEPPHRFVVRDPEFFPSALAMAEPLPIEGNKIQLLNNGDEIFPAMLKAIREAKTSINFEAFLFHSGTVGSQFRDALCERAQAGVKVRVLLDGVGSAASLDNSDVKLMEDKGCAFAYYNPTRSLRTDRLNKRNHRRILVVDGRIGFTGGVGFSDEWQGNGEGKDHWREVHAQIEGPLVTVLQANFTNHWFKETREIISGREEFPPLPKAGELKAQVISTTSHSVAPLALALSIAFASAEKSIWITNAYCAPSDSHVRLLVEAVRRGVDVKLLLPGKHNDQPLTKAAGRSAYGELLEGGVKIYEFEPTMIHAKTVVVDGLFSVFGSSNFDARSSQINEELDVAVLDAGFGKQMQQAFEKDQKRSREYKLEEFKRRGVWERVTELVALPFHSQL
jgi:cardiolipin synthase